MIERASSNRKTGVMLGEIPLSNRYTAGIAGEVFFRKLKDEGKFVGTRCNKCEQTYVPARLFCERCFAELREYIEVADTGVVRAVTVAHVGLDGERLERPAVVGAIQLDGASTVFIHRLLVDPSKARIGMKVKASLIPKPKRIGSILDIRGFEPK